MKISISRKINFLFLLLILVLSGILGGYTLFQSKKNMLKEFDKKAQIISRGLALSIEYPILVGDIGALKKIGKKILEEEDVVLCEIKDANAHMLFQGGARKDDNILNVILPVLTEKGGRATHDDLVLDIAEDNAEMIGEVSLTFSQEDVMSEINAARKTILLLMLVGIILSGIFINWLIKVVLSRPISTLLKGIQVIAKGDLTHKVPVIAEDEIGRLAGAFNTMTDDLKKVTVSVERLQEEQDRFQDVAESTGDWIWEMNDKGQYIYASPIVEHVLGYKPEEVTGKYFYDLFPSHERENLKKMVFEVFAQKKSFKNVITRKITKDGRETIVETNGTTIVDKAGKVIGYRGVDRDITERKAAEEEKEKLHLQLIQSEKMASLGEIAAGIAHELNTPLNVILGYQELLQKKIDAHSPYQEYVSIAIEEVEQCRQLIKDFMTYARPSSNEDLLTQSFNLPEALESSIKLLALHKTKNIKIHPNIEENIPHVPGDQKQIMQVFVNIINNAIQAMPEGGEISISVKHMKNGGLLHNEERVEFRIYDTGGGIKEEDMHKIFDPFFTTKRPGGGTGLGLAICQRIMDNHKGTIRIESDKGKGSTVIGELPVVQK